MATLNFIAFLNDHRTISVPLAFEDGTALTPGVLWNLTLSLKEKETDDDEDSVFQKSTGAGITHSTTNAEVDFLPIDSESIEPGLYYLGIRATRIADEYSKTVAKCTVQFIRDVAQLNQTSLPVYTTEPPLQWGAGGTQITEAGTGSLTLTIGGTDYFIPAFTTDPNA